MARENLRILIDFGSTFTKVVVVDLDRGEILARTQSQSTVKEDVTIGLREALKIAAEETCITGLDDLSSLACSSAAGGLRMICVGFVPELTSKAAREAALGAGAKVVGCYSYKISQSELQEMEARSPDIFLIVGGTDGGNTDVIIHNAKMIAKSRLLTAHIVVAGNKTAYDEMMATFDVFGKSAKFTKNVMPEIGVLDLENCKEEIRNLFMKHIVKAKGINDQVLMPTPLAVLKAARLLSEGFDKKKGFGDIIVIDVGGATTDVVSIGEGNPSTPNTILRALPEPYDKRTVEGDLGVRYNMDALVRIGEKIGQFNAASSDRMMARFGGNQVLPRTEEEFTFDKQLASVAVETATERHVGRLEVVYGPSGRVYLQHGKDLTHVKCVIGTGGPIVFSPHPRRILERMIYDEKKPHVLKPKDPRFFIDSRYILYAAGLLADSNPEKGFELIRKNLTEI